MPLYFKKSGDLVIALADTASFKKNEYFLMNIRDFKKMNISGGLLPIQGHQESSTLILYKELSSPIFQSCESVSQSVRHR